MSNYTQTTFFAPKDLLSTGNPDKTIFGAEIDPELSAISAAIATKVDTAGTGLQVNSTTVSLSITDLTAATPTDGDQLIFADASDSNTEKKVTLTNLLSAIVGTSTQVTSGKLEMDVNALTEIIAPDAALDFLPIYDSSLGALRKVTIDDAMAAASGFVVDSRNLIAGTGLTGGGTLASDRTFNVGAGAGLIASADEIAVGAGSGITAAADSISVNEAQVNHDSLLGFVADEHVAHSGVSILAGSGLTGGGTIAATRTLSVGAGNGIDVAADAISVNISELSSGTLPDARLSSNVPLIDAANTFTATQTISATTPIFRLHDSDALTDEKYFQLRMSGGILVGDSLTDGGADGPNLFTAARSGTSWTSFNIVATSITANGSEVLTEADKGAGVVTTAPGTGGAITVSTAAASGAATNGDMWLQV